MTPAQLTALYAAPLVFLNVALMLLVVSGRFKAGVSLGSGGDAALEGRIRAHGNFAEQAALFLAALFVLASLGPPDWLVHALGGAFLLGRFTHAAGISQPDGIRGLRQLGTVLSLSVFLVLAGTLVFFAVT